jgi:hypothetical protein
VRCCFRGAGRTGLSESGAECHAAALPGEQAAPGRRPLPPFPSPCDRQLDAPMQSTPSLPLPPGLHLQSVKLTIACCVSWQLLGSWTPRWPPFHQRTRIWRWSGSPGAPSSASLVARTLRVSQQLHTARACDPSVSLPLLRCLSPLHMGLSAVRPRLSRFSVASQLLRELFVLDPPCSYLLCCPVVPQAVLQR